MRTSPVAVGGPHVVVLREGPVAAGALELVEVHRVLCAESSEMVLPAVVLEQVRVGRVDLLECEIGGTAHAGAERRHLELRRGEVHVEELDRFGFDVTHQRSPCSCTMLLHSAAAAEHAPPTGSPRPGEALRRHGHQAGGLGE